MSVLSVPNNTAEQRENYETSNSAYLVSDSYPKFDQDPPNYSRSEAETSTTGSHWQGKHHASYQKFSTGLAKHDPSNAGREDASSQTMTTEAGSFISYHSTNDMGEFFIERNGRIYNAKSDLYMLPSDKEEFQRLEKQHVAFVLSFGGLYPCPGLVEDVLKPRDDPDNQPSILDLGCGGGIWALEMAHRFPHASVVGVDLAPVPINIGLIPTNLRFEIDDITWGLDHYHDSFDLVHIRCVGCGIGDYASMMRDAEACLKPGGLIIFIDSDLNVYSEDFVRPVPIGIEEEEGGNPLAGSWMYRLSRETRRAVRSNGTDIKGMEEEIDRGLWDHPLMDPTTVRVASVFVPAGPWASSHEAQENQRLQYAGTLMRQDLIGITRAWHALLNKADVPQERLDQWSTRAEEELCQLRFPMSVRWRMTWGRRLSEPKSPDSRLSCATIASETGGPPPVRIEPENTGDAHTYPKLIIYSTKEEALQAIEMRKAALRGLPASLGVEEVQ